MSDPSPSASMLRNATIETAERNEISNSARDMFKFVQNNYSFNMEGENHAPPLELHDAIVYLLNVVPSFLAEVRKNDRSRSTVSEKTGSDPLSQTTTDHTPQSTISEGDLVDIRDIVPADPSSLPITSIADRYTRSMLKCLAGYPLYEPEPLSELSMEYLHFGVNVGDVGFVRGDGTFDFLFNICPSRNRLMNPPMLPGGFSLETSECPATRTMRSVPPETHLFEGSITRTSSGEYTCEGTEGAILELPEGAIKDEAMNVLPFENLAARYGVEWYKYTMSRGRGISNGSLYLITSFTKCAQWGIAVFDRPCASGQGLKFDSGSSSPFSFWKPISKYQWKGSNTSNTRVTNPNQGNFRNQCVFLRGYKIMIRQDIFDNLRNDQRRGSHTPMSPSSPHAGSSSPTFIRQKASRIRGGGGTDTSLRRLTGESPLTKTMKSAVTESDEVIVHPNFNSALIHPSDIINAALLNQSPDAKVALTHDDVWCNLLQDNFPQVNYATLIKVALSYTSTVDEYGRVSLKKVSDSSNVLNESSCPIGGTEIPALQKPIQCARDEHNRDISIPAQASTTLRPQSVNHSLIAGDEGNSSISVPSRAPSTTPGLPRLRDKYMRQQRRENKGKANPSTAASLEALHHQESRTPYRGNTDPSHRVHEEQRQREEELKKQEKLLELESHGRRQLGHLQEEQQQQLHKRDETLNKEVLSLRLPVHNPHQSPMTARVVKLTVITDFVCAHCFITEHELLNAITYCKDTLNLPLSFELEHLPFRLVSTTSLSENSPKVDRRTFMMQWFGKERFTKAEAAINKWAEEKEIPIKLHGVMSQSTRAHRLCQKAYKIGGQQLQVSILCAVFKAYLQDCKDIADNSVLAEVAQKVGMMTKEQALDFLASDELEKEVNDLCESARLKGITGVPVTIIDRKWATTGSQSSDVYIQIFKKLAADTCSAPSPMPSGPVDEIYACSEPCY